METILQYVAIISAACFAGGALYISIVEHPARIADPEIAIRQFRESYPRAVPWQASTAAICFLSSIVLAFAVRNWLWALGGLALGVVIPFTLIVIYPTNKKILDTATALGPDDVMTLMRRWGALHWIRSILGIGGLIALLAASLG
jgi:hypothetical protein